MRHPSLALTAITIAAFTLSACGRKAEEASSEPAAESADAAGPGIAPAIAPGVAFKYIYNFSLPAAAIGNVQREHAAACARLGPAKCRVTGMNFSKDGSESASGSLDLLLAPDLAHGFASEGIAAVEKADGKLDRADVMGENAGDAVKLSQSDSAGIEAEAKRIEARLAAPGLTANERAELQSQLATLREQLRGNAKQRRSLEQSIATTPVSFSYASHSVIGGDGTLGTALATSWAGAKTVIGFLLVVLGIGLPWAVLLWLGLLGWRQLRRKSSPAEPVVQD